MASENTSISSTETTPFSANSLKLPIEIKRQHSYTTLARLIGAADSQPGSPATPSPCGAAQIKKVVERLEEIDAESRDLLQKLFSMLENDARLERYVRKRLEDPKVSRMWELAEQIMSTQRGHIDVDAILNNNKIYNDDDDGEDKNMLVGKLREVRIDGGADYYVDEMRMERFKVRTFDMGDDVVVDDGELSKDRQ